jgi:hypothetical protein
MVLVRTFEGKKPLGRSRCRLEDSVKTDLKETRFEGLHWINFAQRGTSGGPM